MNITRPWKLPKLWFPSYSKGKKMKKTVTALIFIAALLVEANASTWEGVASVSMGGDMPETGLFAATNSFPRNTVVEVTNLENNRTVRVTITASLDNPGLLVVLSKDAADAIGLNARSIGRVVMRQPPESPSLARTPSAADPDYDPAAMVAAAGVNQALLEELLADEVISTEAAAINFYENLFAEEVPAFRDEGLGEGALPLAQEEFLALANEDEVIPVQEDVGTVLAAVPAPVTPAPVPTPTPVPAPAPAPTPTPAASAANPIRNDLENYDIALVPAGNRTPNNGQPIIDPSNIIAPIPAPAQTPQPEPVIIPAQIIPSIPAQPTVVPAEPARTSGQTSPTQPAAPITPAVAQATQISGLSAPVINELEKGKYYIQLAALSSVDSVARELSKIGNSLPLAIQNGGTAERPVYRILIGPVNLGESGAILQRFQSTYRDAFVRLGS
jgi:hypothetical protein